MLLSLIYFALHRLLRALAASDDLERDVELLVLRHQLRVLNRQRPRPALRRGDRLLLAAASRMLPKERWMTFLVSPQTLLRCHRELVRRRWTYRRGPNPGRPALQERTVRLILRLAKENPRRGYQRLRGEFLKLGITVSATTVANILRHSGLGPAPRRKGPSWAEFVSAQARGFLACDFLTVETLRLKTFYVLAIELSTRRVHLLGSTLNAHSGSMTQQARNLAIDGRFADVRFLLHDRDAKFCGPFDEVFSTEGVRVIETPIRAPKANAFAERWVETLRRGCLDHLLILGHRHLEVVLQTYVGHYNAARPHRGIGLDCPDGRPSLSTPTATIVWRRDLLGGLIHEYELAA